ncbi:lithostathine-1 isoform X1 [Meriones unguiculatus]|uniref:lithostathine-1 isoform X1 n=1 Tax=Meriones unguiculatus TaxID=10047 RepID=UPI000B4EA338|nr:lithostathine-1 isoform X1 [Meriones unguiculatus]
MARSTAYFILASCLMFLSPSQGQEAEEDLPSSRISCPEGSNAYSSYCYYFIEERLTWADADLFCQNMNSGYLVSVLSQAEGNFVASLIKESGTTDANVWTGLHDPKRNRRWHWSSGSLFIYKSWATGSPNSSNRGYCVSLTSNTGYKKWRDSNCDAQYSFVCKFKS